jgi:hypothetical protein
MNKVRMSRYELATVLAICLAASTGNVFAQDVAKSDLERCASLETSEAKLACFEALTSQDTDDAKATDRVEESTPKTPVISDSPPVVESASPASVVPAAAPAAVIDPPEKETEEASTPTPVVQADAVVDHDESGDADTAEDSDEVLSLTVAEVTEGRYKVLSFHMTNGQVWRQMEGRRFRYPNNAPFDVIISRGMMGDYQLRTGENEPMTRVRLVQ